MINKIDDLEKLKELNNSINVTREQIKKYSTYDINDISVAITRVISSYEGIEYICIKNRFNFDEDYFYKYGNNKDHFYDANFVHIIPKEKAGKEYARYRIRPCKDDKDKCYLPPAYYTPHKKCYYVKDFLNYVYIMRVNNNVEGMDYYLSLADQFIEETKYEIELRQNSISEQKPKNKILEYEPSMLGRLYWF